MIKKLLFPALVGLSMAFASCETDPCKDLDGKCGSGTCFEGACVCDEGYEADASGVCNVEWSAKFVGDYLGTDVSTSPTSPNNPDFNGTFSLKATSPCKISAVSGSTTSVKILNLGGFESQLNGNVKKANSADESATVIEFTDALDNNGSKWTGTLNYSSTGLTGTYTLTFADGDIVNSTITYTKQ
jgi:hypothetical protein